MTVAQWKPVALTAMHGIHLELGATMVDMDGWQLPAVYTSAQEELGRVRDAVGICDISPGTKLLVQGRALDDFLGAAFPHMRRMNERRVTVQTLESDGGSQEVVVARLSADEALLLARPNRAAEISELLDRAPAECAHAVDISSAMAGVKIAGPQAQRLVSRLTEMDTGLEAFPDMTCAQGMVAEVYGMLLRREIAGMPSFDLIFGMEFGQYMWHALTQAGEDIGLVPFGIEALARLEGAGDARGGER